VDAREVKNDEFLAPAGRVLDSMLSENQCEGWLEGYLLTGRHGLFNSYELHSNRRFYVQPARQMAEGMPRAAMASADFVAELSACLSCSGSRTTMDLRTGPRFLDHVINKKPISYASIFRPTPTACCRFLIIACAAGLRQCCGCGQARPPTMAHHGRSGRALPEESAFGNGRNDRTPNRMW